MKTSTFLSQESIEQFNINSVQKSNIINQPDRIYIYRIFHHQQNTQFFSNAYGIFTKIDCSLNHKTNLNKFKELEIGKFIETRK